MSKGFFLTVDGLDGAGKSTLVRAIEKWVRDVAKKPYIVTKEPGSPHNDMCVRIREMIVNKDSDLDDQAEVFLFMADRCNHVNKVIRPALDEGKFVICDRYIEEQHLVGARVCSTICLGKKIERLRIIEEIENYVLTTTIISDSDKIK